MNRNCLCPGFWDNDNYKILDQTLLPESTEYLSFETYEEVAEAIKSMQLRGAPLIGAAASSGLALSVKKSSVSNMKKNFEKAVQLLSSTRPTAVNLFTVIKETEALFHNNYKKGLSSEKMFRKLKDFSVSVHERDIKRNRTMGKYGAEYISRVFGEKKLSVITHCNAGALATCGYGTALGVIRTLHKKNKIKMVWVDETRPLLQGSRLTAYELEKEQISFTVITDSAASHVMSQKKADFIITGADRVAANGDTANKTGTRSLAVNAHFHNIPFFTALPCETIDMNTQTGKFIEIEERNKEEIISINGTNTAPRNSRVFNPAFDIVPAALVSAIITEKGIIHETICKNTVSELYSGSFAVSDN